MRILQFSGGKDSLAVLLLMQEQLDDITVLWCDTGDSFPETHRQMGMIRGMCPNFVTVWGNQPEVIRSYGYPVDVLPVRSHKNVQYLAEQSRPLLQDFFGCCARSLHTPMHEKTLALGATEIIRGQKLCDPHKSPVRSGDVIDGILYTFPLEDWTDEQVMELVRSSGLLPDHYSEANTSLDCMHCTAYLAENSWKLPYLKRRYPETAARVYNRLKEIKQSVQGDMRHLDDVLEG